MQIHFVLDGPVISCRKSLTVSLQVGVGKHHLFVGVHLNFNCICKFAGGVPQMLLKQSYDLLLLRLIDAAEQLIKEDP